MKKSNDTFKRLRAVMKDVNGDHRPMESMLPHGADPHLLNDLDGNSFYDSLSLDHNTPEENIRVAAKQELLKKYEAKSS